MDMFFREFLGSQLIQIGLAYPGCVTPRKPLGEGHWIRSGDRESNKYLSFLLSQSRGVLRLHVGARWGKHMTQIALMSA